MTPRAALTSESAAYLVATARNCVRRFISRSMVLRCR